jgi:3-oxoacyl-[acyl-carrier-protein] synthase-1
MKRRVVITGRGIISSLGNSVGSVCENLKKGVSGIRKVDEWEELGLKSTVAGIITDIEPKLKAAGIPKRLLHCMPNDSLYCTLSAKDAIADADLDVPMLRNRRFGCIVGSGIGDLFAAYKCGDDLYNQRVRRISPYTIVRTMNSSCSANVASVFPVGGRSYSISSACATSAHNIGHAFELIRGGVLDAAIAGGGEDVNAVITSGFCAMRMAVSIRYNDTPEEASRPYDEDRDGFVISGGGGVLVVEALEHAKARGARIYCEIIGYGATSNNGHDIFLPEPGGESTSECIRIALQEAGIQPEAVDYINTHGTSTPAGDIAEIKAIQKVFLDKTPMISSTKSLSGHALGSAGVHELIYCMIMMDQQFVAPSANIDSLDPDFEGVPIVRETTEKELITVLSNNFGFGGTNAVTILRKYAE